MSIKETLVRFTLIYIISLVSAGIALAYFEIDRMSGLNTGILLGAVYWACYSFTKKNERFFTDNEKRKVIIGCIIIDLAVQLIFITAGTASGEISMSFRSFLFGIIFSAVLHGVVIWFWVGYTKKLCIKHGLIEE